MAKRRVGVVHSPSMLEPVRPGALTPDRAFCLPTLSHYLIVNKTSLSLSLSLSRRIMARKSCAPPRLEMGHVTVREHLPPSPQSTVHAAASDGSR